MTRISPQSLTHAQRTQLWRLPPHTSIYCERIVCRPGWWYTVQVDPTHDTFGTVLAREDDLDAALTEALTTQETDR